MNAKHNGKEEKLATDGTFAKRARQRIPLTQEELAVRADISTRTISDIERGIGASAIALRAYAKAIDDSLDWVKLLSTEARERLFGATPAKADVLNSSPNEHFIGTVVHSLSGRWELLLRFQRWRGRNLVQGESVVVHGMMDLWIPTTGDAGVGIAIGELQLQLSHPSDSSLMPYSSTILVVDEIDQIRCVNNCLTFRSKTFSRFVDTEEGDRPLQVGVLPRLANGTVFNWSLSFVQANQNVLQGKYWIIGDDRDDAVVQATRR